ncbi:MAG: hypothetical protein R2864_09565 [Syntrophotaleaceae bacterium]
MPLIAGYFLSQKWPELLKTSVRPSNMGLAAVLGALALLVVGIATAPDISPCALRWSFC